MSWDIFPYGPFDRLLVDVGRIVICPSLTALYLEFASRHRIL